MIVRPRHFVAFVAAASVSAAAAVAGISHLVQAATIPADLVLSPSGIRGEAPMVRAQAEAAPPSLEDVVAFASDMCGIDGDIYAELIGRESSWRQTDAEGRTLRSPKGALGLSQILPTTAAEISPTLRPDVAADNALAGACHLRRLLDRFGSYRVALAAYVIGANSPHLHTSTKAKAYAEGILAAAEARR